MKLQVLEHLHVLTSFKMQAKIRGHRKIMTHVSIWRSCDGFSAVGALEVRNQNREPESCAFSRIRSPFEKRLEGAAAA